MVGAGAIGHRKSSRLIGNFVDQFAVRIGNVERLNQMQTWSARRRFIDPIRFQSSAVDYDDE